MKRRIICTLLLATGTLVHAASFDCTKATTTIEKAICSDGHLSDLDGQLALVYKKTLTSSSNADSLKSEQRLWLTSVRNKCQDAACLKHAYAERITQLDSSPTPSPMQLGQSAPSAGTDLATANDSRESAPKTGDIVPAYAPPVVQPSLQAQKIETPAQSPAPVQEKSASAIENVVTSSSTPTNPGLGITDVFHVLFSIGMIALVAGMVRPSLAGRWINAPTRKRVFGIMLIYLVPVAAVSSFTRTPERIAYDKSVQEQHEAERREKQQAREAASDGHSSGGSRRQSRYQAAANRFVSVGDRVVKAGLTQSNPSCGAAFREYEEQYLGDINPKVIDARRTYRSDPGNLNAVEEIEAQILEVNVSNLASVCGL